VLLCLTGRIPPLNSPLWHCGLMSGFGVFLAVAAAAAADGGRLLEYPRTRAGALILLIESGLTLSIALILTSLFAGASTIRRRSSPSGGPGHRSNRP
jgi:hypothetical protein